MFLPTLQPMNLQFPLTIRQCTTRRRFSTLFYFEYLPATGAAATTAVADAD